MKLIKIAGACVIIVVVIGAAFASSSYAYMPNWGLETLLYASFPTYETTPLVAPTATTPGYVSPLLVREAAVLTRQGISPARASEAIDVQDEVARTHIVNDLETAMAGEYAGVWFEPATAQMHIGVTSPVSRRVAEGVVVRTGLVSDVSETPVRSTRAQLVATQKRWNRRLAHLFAREEAETGLAPQNNAVSIVLSSSVPPLEQAAIKREASEAKVNVVVTISSSSRLQLTLDANTTKCKKFVKNEAYCDKPLTAGVRIEAANKEFCTAGPLALPKAAANREETYVLTAGHCIKKGGGEAKAWSATNRVPETKEIGPAGAFIFGKEGDVGVIKISNPGAWAVAGNPSLYAVMAEWGKAGEPIESTPVIKELEPLVGRTTCRQGQTTGQACGTIRKEGQFIEPEVGVKIESLVEWEAKAGEPKAEGGDSGGPFYSSVEGGVAMEGTLVGEKGETKNLVYEPLGTAFKELNAVKKLNLELLTTANEKRGPCGS
jgi:Trypsin